MNRWNLILSRGFTNHICRWPIMFSWVPKLLYEQVCAGRKS